MRAFVAAVLLSLAAVAVARADAGSTVMGLVRTNRWVEAQAAAARLPDPVAAKLVTFYRLLAPDAARVTDIDTFRAQNPGWPLAAALRRRRDAAILAEPDDAVALAACDAEPPAFPGALLRCADAARRHDRPDQAADWARAAWIGSTPAAHWDSAFLRAWGGVVGAADQWARFDRLAWADIPAAALQVAHLSAADQNRAEARLGLQRDDPQAPALLAALPAADRAEPAMLLDEARWLRRHARLVDAAALWQRAGAEAERAATGAERPAFATERGALARGLLTAGDAPHAFAVADDTAQTAPEPVADAAFLAGWIALRRLHDPGTAAQCFARLAQVSRAAITQARAHYWMGRAAAAAGDAATAAREYRAAAAYPSTFYGQLGALADGDDPAHLLATIQARRDPAATPAQAAAFAERELARAAAWLVAWGEPGRASAFLLRLSEQAASPAEQTLAARLAIAFAMPQTAVALARAAGRSGVTLLDSGWPAAAHLPAPSPADPALVLSVIRQESSFDPAVVSPAGARGLMQLLPATAAVEAQRLGLPASTAALTADPGYNVRLGSAYLAGLLARFAGSVPLAAAAYNAGPARVTAWLAGRTLPQHPDLPTAIDWIELIPFGETRNYVQRVIESAVVYQARLGEPASFPLPWPPSPA